jgi:hypothetical protein
MKRVELAKPMRCAIYARFSTDDQNPGTIDAQVDLCKDYMEAEVGLTLVAEPFTDEGISRRSPPTRTRPAFVDRLQRLNQLRQFFASVGLAVEGEGGWPELIHPGTDAAPGAPTGGCRSS